MKFNSILLLIIAFFVISCRQQPESKGRNAERPQDSLTSFSSTSAEPDEPLLTVQDIKEAYGKTIAKLESGTLDSVSFEYSCNQEKNGTLSYYSERGKLRLIVHRYNEYSHFSGEDRYFVNDSSLFFVHQNQTSWAFEEGPEGSTRDNITEKRIYLVNQQALKCLEKKYVIHSQATDNPSSESVPSKEVDCASSSSIVKSYALLAQYRDQPPVSGCLGE